MLSGCAATITFAHPVTIPTPQCRYFGETAQIMFENPANNTG